MSVLPLPVRASAVTARRRLHPSPLTELSRLTRYRGGMYSHTVDTVVFTDGSTARTDLIRLNPGIAAYSLDFAGVAPTRPSRYDVQTWSAVPHLAAKAHEAEVDWILRNSVPTLAPAELSSRLRAAGYALGRANISEHEAIAGTQAAIWYLTNGLELDNRPLNVPVAVLRDGGLVVEFDGEPQLGGYAVSGLAGTWRLQKSVDGVVWRDVAGSTLTTTSDAESGKALGVGATVSRASSGFRFYRLVGDGAERLDSDSIRFWLNGSGHYRNSDKVVHLYNYLLAGAREARQRTVAPALVTEDATADDGLVGPLRLEATDTVAVTVSGGGHVVDDDGLALTLVEPGAEFYVRTDDVAVTLTVKVPGRADGFGGRILTGVASDGARLTPVALAVPTQLVVDFELRLRVGVTGYFHRRERQRLTGRA